MSADPREGEAVDDATIVRSIGGGSGLADSIDDATIVRPASDVQDLTIVRPAPAKELPVDDTTIVRAAPAPTDRASDDDSAVVDHATILRRVAAAASTEQPEPNDDTAPRPKRQRRRERRAPAAVSQESLTSSVALPVEDPEAARRWGSRERQGFDPIRYITPVPGTAPWDAEPQPERGVRAETSVVYGPRAKPVPELFPSTDQVHQQLGDAPPARVIEVRPAREALPSLAARSRRTSRLTLLIGAALVLVAVVGLVVVATIAFA